MLRCRTLLRVSACCTRRGVPRQVQLRTRTGAATASTAAPPLSTAAVSRAIAAGSLHVLQRHTDSTLRPHAPAPDSNARRRRVLAHSSAVAAPVRGARRKWVRAIRALIRAVLIFLGWSPIAAAGAAIALLNRGNLAPSALIEAWWSLALWAVEQTGPAHIKFVQWASSRPDLFTKSVCGRLSRFHASTRPHSWRSTSRALDQALGPAWRESLHVLSSKPIGSGCVAQVYQGVLRTPDGDKPVAVKVVHPAVKDQIEVDVDVMRGVAALAEMLVPRASWLSLRDSVEEFAKLMAKQLDLRVEAAALDRFTRNFSSDPSVTFPQPVPGLVRELVLVETLIKGEHLSAIVSGNTGATDGPVLSTSQRRALAKIGLRAFLQMLFLDNFVHGDLHPGNIMVATQPGRGGRPQPALVFLDAGITTELSSADRRNFIDLFHAIATGDGKRAGTLLIERSRDHNCDDPKAFTGAVESLVAEALADDLMLSKVHVGQLIGTVLGLCAQHRVKLESNFVSVVIAIGVLEGVGRALDPDINILREALPVLLQARLKGNV